MPGARRPAWPRPSAALARAYELDPANPVTGVNLAEVLYRRGDYERARFYIRRVNNSRIGRTRRRCGWRRKIEHSSASDQARDATSSATQLRKRFPQSREAAAFERGALR